MLIVLLSEESGPGLLTLEWRLLATGLCSGLVWSSDSDILCLESCDSDTPCLKSSDSGTLCPESLHTLISLASAACIQQEESRLKYHVSGS